MIQTKQRMPAAERRELVLDAAVAAFAAHGLAGTSTEDVAQRAGISQPYLFRLFPTKKALFLELVDRCFRRVRDAFTAAAGDRTGEEAMAAMADAYERLLDDRVLLLLQMQAYAACDDPEIRAATRTGFKKLWELVERLTGLPFQTVVDFFAVGMLMNVAAAMDLPAVDERWTSWCPKDSPA
jgi:AcrR family transcriptional regulator